MLTLKSLIIIFCIFFLCSSVFAAIMYQKLQQPQSQFKSAPEPPQLVQEKVELPYTQETVPDFKTSTPSTSLPTSTPALPQTPITPSTSLPTSSTPPTPTSTPALPQTPITPSTSLPTSSTPPTPTSTSLPTPPSTSLPTPTPPSTSLPTPTPPLPQTPITPSTSLPLSTLSPTSTLSLTSTPSPTLPPSIPSTPSEPILISLPTPVQTDVFQTGLPAPVGFCPFGTQINWDKLVSDPYQCKINKFTNFVTVDGKKGFTTTELPTELAKNMCWTANGQFQKNEENAYMCQFTKGSTLTSPTNILNIYKEDLIQTPITVKPNVKSNTAPIKFRVIYRMAPTWAYAVWRNDKLSLKDPSWEISEMVFDAYDPKTLSSDSRSFNLYHVTAVPVSDNSVLYVTNKVLTGSGLQVYSKLGNYSVKTAFATLVDQPHEFCVGQVTTPYVRQTIGRTVSGCNVSGWSRLFTF